VTTEIATEKKIISKEKNTLLNMISKKELTISNNDGKFIICKKPRTTLATTFYILKYDDNMSKGNIARCENRLISWNQKVFGVTRY